MKNQIYIIFIMFFLTNIYAESNVIQLINKMKSGDSIKIVCYGDSITWGYENYFKQSDNNYPHLLESNLQTKYANKNIKIINNGKNSMTSKWGKDNLYTLVIDEKPDLAIVSFGINDVIYLNSINNYLDNMNFIYKELEKNGIECLFLSPTPVFGAYKRGVSQYKNKIMEMYKEENINSVDVYKPFQKLILSDKQPVKYLPDFIHPINYYSIISDEIMLFIDSYSENDF